MSVPSLPCTRTRARTHTHMKTKEHTRQHTQLSIHKRSGKRCVITKILTQSQTCPPNPNSLARMHQRKRQHTNLSINGHSLQIDHHLPKLIRPLVCILPPPPALHLSLTLHPEAIESIFAFMPGNQSCWHFVHRDVTAIQLS